MIFSLHIVVLDKGGKAEVAYAGGDQVAADKAFLAAKDCEAARYFSHMPYTRIRYPEAETRDAEQRAAQSEAQRTAAIDRKRAESAEKRKQAEDLKAQAKKLSAEADEQEKQLT